MIKLIIKVATSVLLLRVIVAICVLAVIIISYAPAKYIKITISAPLWSNNTYIDNYIVNSEIDYIGIYEYEFKIDGLVSVINKSCSYKKDFCYRQSDDISKVELSTHANNECYYIKNFNKIGSYVSCPVIVKSKLRGYVAVGTNDIMQVSDIKYYARSVAESIATKTPF